MNDTPTETDTKIVEDKKAYLNELENDDNIVAVCIFIETEDGFLDGGFAKNTKELLTRNMFGVAQAIMNAHGSQKDVTAH
jgi:hypothetical protein